MDNTILQKVKTKDGFSSLEIRYIDTPDEPMDWEIESVSCNDSWILTRYRETGISFYLAI